MRAAGIDIGKVRVGLAISDELGLLAHPRPYVDGRDPGRAVERLARLAREEGIEVFVVGLPRSLNGREGMAARRARRFAERLRSRSGARIELLDEWLTTRQAEARLREQGLDARRSRTKVDSAAAAVLLQSWLDARSNRADRES